MAPVFALLIADPNNGESEAVFSKHRTAATAHKARQGLLANVFTWRWSYVAKRRDDGTYPGRVEALSLPAHANRFRI